MKKWMMLVVCLLFFYTSFSQRRAIDSILSIVPSLADSSKMKAYYFLGAEYINIALDSSSYYANLAVVYAKKYGNKRVEAESYSLLGVAEKDKGNYDKAITYHLKSLKIHEASHDKKETAIAYNDLGVLYKKMNRWDEALVYYKLSNQLCREISLSKGISMTYNNIGTIMKQKSPQNPALIDSALKYYQLALAEAEKTNDTYAISTCLSNIGGVYIENRSFDKALSTFKKCLEYDKRNEDKYGMVTSYMQLGNVYNTLKQYRRALPYADSAYTLALNSQLRRERLDVIDLKGSIQKNLGNYKEALQFAGDYRLLNDSLINEETARQISELQAKYETANKEDEIVRLRHAEEINALKLAQNQLLLQKRNYEMTAICAIAILGALIAFLLYSRKQLKQKQLREKAIADTEYNERMRIAKDVHDDIGAGLSKISLIAALAQKRAIGKVNYEADIDNISVVSKQLVDNMHDLIWVLNPEHTTVDHLVTRLREYCSDYLDGMPLTVHFDFPQIISAIKISREAQRNIFLTVKESLNNCIKHSGCTEIHFSVKLEDNVLNIALSDNGKGFDVMEKSKGNGLPNMKQRINVIGGSYIVTSAVNKGCATEIMVHLSNISVGKNTTLV